jgi:hypothetical protein
MTGSNRNHDRHGAGTVARLGAWLMAAVLGLLGGAARAELGGDANSVRAEARQAQASLHVSTFGAYDVHEMQAPNGATVRQFVDRRGKVFAVAWRSRGPANLSTLLGRHYATYRTLGAQRIDLHHGALHSPGLVVEVGGVLDRFSGRAYVPGDLPAGLSSAGIR